MSQVFERMCVFAALPRPLRRMDARSDAVVSALQSIDYQPGGRTSSSSALVCRHDPSLTPRTLAERDGTVIRVRVDPIGRRVALVSWPRSSQRATDVEILGLDDGRTLAQRRFEGATVFDAVPFAGGVALGRHQRPWTPQHGPKVELWSAGLEHVERALIANDAGFDVEVVGDVVAATGIDLHIWDQGRAISLHESRHRPPGEVGPCSMSADGRAVAVAHDRRGEEPAVYVLDAADPHGPVVTVQAPVARDAVALGLSSDAKWLALVLDQIDDVFVYDARTGALSTRIPTARPSHVAWIDARTLLVGGAGLELWRTG